MTPRTVSLLGSTGSIGVQALDVIARHRDAFDVVALAAGGSDPARVAEQAAATRPRLVAVANSDAVQAVRDALASAGAGDIPVEGGMDAVVAAAGIGADVVLNGITGSVGLRPTLAALGAGSTLALANKESLVAGGALVTRALQRPDQMVPVDSEHSALAQSLRSGTTGEVKRLVLTASGGAFRGKTRAELADVTPEQALKHPNWDMGPVVTMNSATLVNKALEVIEAHWLFDMPYERIDVVVHPQSIVHSMVEFVDGATIAQASPPDMRLPIALGLSWPERLDDVTPYMDWTRAQEWTFEPLDEQTFPAISVAREAAAASDLHPAVFNAANEQAVAAFAADRLPFLEIVETVRRVLEQYDAPSEVSLDAVDHAEAFARSTADALIALAYSGAMLAALGIAVMVVGLMVSIALHEIGHLAPAKKFGVKVSEYFVGFGPTVWSTKRGETEYGLKAFPLGGYVRLVGMVPPARAVKPVTFGGWAGNLIRDAREAAEEEIGDDDARAFYHLAWWRKIIVMAGGPVMNLIIAAVLFTVVVSGIGVPAQTLTVRDTIACVLPSGATECAPGDQASPAVAAGLQPGDTFVSADGRELGEWGDLTSYVSERPGQSIDLVVERDGELLNLTLTPASREVTDPAGASATQTIGYLGVYSLVEYQRQPWWQGVLDTGSYLGQTVGVVAQLPSQLYHVARAAIGLEERSESSVMGIVGIGRAAGDVTSVEGPGITLTDRVAQLLLLLAGLNLALFVFNVIPLVPLDGGHVASALWQGIKNGWARVRNLPRPAPVDVARMMPVAYGVFGILILMSLVLVYADVVAPVRVA